jgi:hypothetical protein
VLFRYLYRRRVLRAFGHFVDRSILEQQLAHLSEWQALKFFLPNRWFYTAEQEEASLREIAAKLRPPRIEDGAHL